MGGICRMMDLISNVMDMLWLLLRMAFGYMMGFIFIYIPYLYRRYVIYRYRCEIDRKKLDIHEGDLIEWCNQQDFDYMLSYSRESEYNFRNASDVVAFKLMWAEYVK